MNSADVVIAIDQIVRATLPANLPVHVIHSSFTGTPSEVPDAANVAQFERLRPAR